MTARNAYAAYRSSEIETLNQRDLVVKLYEGVERFLARAAAAMDAHQIEPAHNDCTRSRAIITELLSTLNMEAGGEIAERLRNLYLFFIDEITRANLRKDPAIIRAIIPIVASLREAWQQIPDEHANTTSLEANHGHALNVVS